jgi:long-chain fatty acid transport protein
MNGIRKTLTSTGGSALFIVVAALLAGAFVGSAWAGGLYLNEFGTPSMGVASAGAEAVCMDASTSFHNSAGMTLLEGNELMLTGGFLKSTAEFDPASNTPVAGGDGGDAGGYAPLLAGFYTHSLSEDLKLGINLISISAALLDYDDDWSGRYQCQDLSIFTMTLNPSIAYRVNDWMSIGGGVGVMYGELELDVAIPLPGPGGDGKAELDGDDVDVGFSLSAMFEPSERTRLGVLYWSKIEPSYGGDLKISPLGAQVGTDTELTFPQFIRAGIYHEINDKWALLGTIAWEDWSELESLLISTGAGTAAMPRNWDDTWHYAGGVRYRIDDLWVLQGGIAYDTSPVDSDDRTADMPIDRQVRFALGIQHRWSEKVSMGLTLEYIDFGRANINNSLIGEYDKNEAFLLAYNINWK